MGRPKYAQHADLHAWANATGLALADRFLEPRGRGCRGVRGVRGGDEDAPRHRRGACRPATTALQAAARHASEVPLACVEACLELVSVAEALAGRSNVNAASDLNVAALLGEAAARGAGANVMINLPSIGDPDIEGEMMTRVMELMSEVENLAAATHEAVGGEPRDPVPASARA